MSGNDGLACTVAGSTAVYELARPARYNCLSQALWTALTAAVAETATDPAMRVILIAAQGEHFCTGADLDEFAAVRNDPAARAAFIAAGHAGCRALEESPLPVVVAAQGLCLAGGLELLLAADVGFAADTARFGDQHARYGLFPGWGATQRLPRVIGERRALDFMLSAHWIDAPTAATWGLINRVVPASELRAQALAYCDALGRLSRPGLAAMKQAVRAAAVLEPAAGLALEAELAAGLYGGDDVAEGLAAFAARRTPQFGA